MLLRLFLWRLRELGHTFRELLLEVSLHMLDLGLFDHGWVRHAVNAEVREQCFADLLAVATQFDLRARPLSALLTTTDSALRVEHAGGSLGCFVVHGGHV